VLNWIRILPAAGMSMTSSFWFQSTGGWEIDVTEAIGKCWASVYVSTVYGNVRQSHYEQSEEPTRTAPRPAAASLRSSRAGLPSFLALYTPQWPCPCCILRWQRKFRRFQRCLCVLLGNCHLHSPRPSLHLIRPPTLAPGQPVHIYFSQEAVMGCKARMTHILEQSRPRRLRRNGQAPA
jgi:hypothetical protein